MISDYEALFMSQNDRRTFMSREELKAFLNVVFLEDGPWKVPSPQEGRLAFHRERECLKYFLRLNLEAFQYPLEVTKSERPDFMIKEGNGAVLGVEQTDCGPEAYQRWLFQAEEGEQIAFFPDRNGEVEEAGVCGPEIFQEARADIVGSWLGKTVSINKPGYQRADHFILLAYVQSNAPLFFEGDFEKLMGGLPDYEILNSYNRKFFKHDKAFSRVLVILGKQMKAW